MRSFGLPSSLSDRLRLPEGWDLPPEPGEPGRPERRRPEKPREVVRAIVAVAQEAGLGLPTDQHLRIEDICSALPSRAAAVQCLIASGARMLAEHHGGVRALARAMAKQGGDNLESTLRRWLGLAQSKPRSIVELNPIVSRLKKFSRTEIRKLRRRVTTGSGPLGDRQTVLAYLSLLRGAERPVVPTPEEVLAFPSVVVATPKASAISSPS